MPIIILEGVDKAGKSTLSKQICKVTNGTYMHFSKPDIDPYDYFVPAIYAADRGEIIVCDRHCIGEKVYAKIKGEDSKWKPGDYEKMLAELNGLGAVIIHVWESRENLYKRMNLLGDDYVNKSEMLDIQEEFRKEILRISQEYKNITCLSFRPTFNFINILR